MQTLTSNSSVTAAQTTQRTKILLSCGLIAGPFYILMGFIQLLIRPGFDMRVNALSQMALGELGWIQTANFVVSGLLVIAAAVGMRQVLRSRPGGTWGPILIALYGLGLLGAAIFSADPSYGFPPGSPPGPANTLSAHGLLHFATSGIGFFALIGACFVFARRFAWLKEPVWMLYSLLTGLIFLIAFVGTASGAAITIFIPALWVANFLAWLWLSLVSAWLIKTLRDS